MPSGATLALQQGGDTVAPEPDDADDSRQGRSEKEECLRLPPPPSLL